MAGRTWDVGPDRIARLAGLGYLVIIVAAIFAEVAVRSRLVVSGDAAATAANIVAAEQLFRTGIASDLVMLTFDVVLAVALYVLFRPVSRALSALAAAFRLVHASVYGVTLLNLVAVLLLLGGAEHLSAFAPDQLHSLATVLLGIHGFGYAVGLVFFGFHCLVLGVLVLRSGFLPKVLGVLLFFAAAGYLSDSFAQLLYPGYGDLAGVFYIIVFAPAFVAELSLCLWLLFRGVKTG